MAATLFSKALLYLGLVDETPAPVESDGTQNSHPTNTGNAGNIPGVRVDPPPATTRLSPIRPGVTPMPIHGGGAQTDVLLVEEFGDTKILADRIRDHIPVVLDLRVADRNLWQRTIDFSAGVVYALDGTMAKVGEGLVLVRPPGVELSEAEKSRLAGLGFFQLEQSASPAT